MAHRDERDAVLGAEVPRRGDAPRQVRQLAIAAQPHFGQGVDAPFEQARHERRDVDPFPLTRSTEVLRLEHEDEDLRFLLGGDHQLVHAGAGCLACLVRYGLVRRACRSRPVPIAVDDACARAVEPGEHSRERREHHHPRALVSCHKAVHRTSSIPLGRPATRGVPAASRSRLPALSPVRPHWTPSSPVGCHRRGALQLAYQREDFV